MGIGIWIAIVLSAIVAFIVGDYYGQPLHWYLFILIVVAGFFIQIVILIVKVKDKNS